MLRNWLTKLHSGLGTFNNRNRRRRRRRPTGRSVLSRLRHQHAVPAETLEDRTMLTTFSNMDGIVINDNTEATPYPSTIDVSPTGVQATVVDVNVTIHGITHTHPDDIDVLLVGPAGGAQNTILFSDAGLGDDATDVDLTFDDSAAGPLPDAAFVAGSYQPTDYDGVDGPGENLPSPAPPTAGVSLAVFNGANAVGTWSLFVDDDAQDDVGNIAGWSLDIQLGGDVVIDAGADADDGAADAFEIILNGANLEVRVNNSLVFNEPVSGITSLTINGSGDDDTLTVDHGGGEIDLPITFAGSTGSDTLAVNGGDFTTITNNFTNTTDGNINFAGGGSTITYTGLEPVLLNVGTVADIIFNLPAGANPDVLIGDDTAANFPATAPARRIRPPSMARRSSTLPLPTLAIR